MTRAQHDIVNRADDAVIIRRSWDEPECFAELFDRHAPHIHRYVVRRLGREFADDLVADTFLAAFSRRHRYDLGRDDARPWLYGIATNLVRRHRRDEARRYRLAQLPAEPDVACHADRIVADVTAIAMRRQLGTALAGLAPRDLDVLLLIAWEQLTYEEVAAALRIPVGTVRSRLSRARKNVRKSLAERTPDIDSRGA